MFVDIADFPLEHLFYGARLGFQIQQNFETTWAGDLYVELRFARLKILD